LLPERIAEVRQRCPDLHFQCANAEQLEFPEASFDLVLLFTVFSSILDGQMARNVACEVTRVLKPGGAVLWYDFRYDNPRNPNVRGMTRRHIGTLFPGFQMHLHTITLFPALARRLGHLTSLLYPVLAAMPPLRTHYLGLLLPD
jgi:ubiquinone/menaquinone biosynthesis C-methylase UbiE